MKKTLITLVCAEQEGIHIQTLLQRLAFHVEVFHQLDGALSHVGKGVPDVLLIVRDFMLELSPKTTQSLARVANAGCTLVVLGDEPLPPLPFPCERLPVAAELRDLHQLLGRCVESYSRQQPRIETNLPGLYANGDNSYFCEIVNLSASGAYIRLGTPFAQGVESVRLYIPLLGMKKELELHSDIVFQTKPSEENNYQQGAGIRFRIDDESMVRQLEEYLAFTVNDDLRAAIVMPIISAGRNDGGSQKRGRRDSAAQ